jgi:hypothetical protein
MLVIGAVVLIVACSGIAFWLGRSSGPASQEPPPTAGTPAATESEIPNVEPTLSPGSRVEALSAEGWQRATIKEISGDQALIAYETAALGEERVDVRLIRKPESELVAKAAPAAPAPRAPQTFTNPTATPTTPPAPPLGPRPTTASKIPTGDYTCDLEGGATKDVFTDEKGAQIAVTLTIEIVSDRVYRAFNGEDDNYSYDPASGRITWENGMLGEEQPGQYRADSKSIVTSVGGIAMTCTLGR